LIQAQHVLYGPSVNEHATLSHPARKDRLAAIARGYNEAMQKQSGQKITHPTHPDIQQAITQFKKKNYDTSLPVLLDHASNAMVWPYLGQAYLWGRGLITDQEKGIYYYNLAAEQEDTTALYVLGLLEYLGHEVPKNKNKSLHHFKQAAGKGMAMAQCATALLLVGDSAAETHPENIQEAIQWWRKAANQKNPSGLFYLGVSYLWDLDNHPDPSKAKTLFEQALKANSPEALCFYGLLNEEGSIPEICPKINLPEAKKYYKLAAEWYQVKPAIEACKRLGIPVVNRSKRDFAEPNGIELFETVFWEMIK
ncbi:MAG TPA: tetratricopeptide repeat protein, partial [Chitinophagaceae bacterium]|nr:tetratricopeptide repeat protein [Chitinophagaceae bacterium]